MKKDDTNSNYNLDDDPWFSENFYNQIDKVISDADSYSAEHASNEIHTKDEIEEYRIQDPNSLIDEELSEINRSLAKQICDEIDQSDCTKVEKKGIKWHKIQRVALATLIVIIGLVGFFGFTKTGNQTLMKMGLNISGNIWEIMTGNFEDDVQLVEDSDHIDEDDLNSDAEEIDTDTIVWPEHPGEGRHEDYAYNILLLGEEAIGSGTSRGRTDLIIIATLNTKEKSVKLTSLLRDTLVQIPGYKDNKLNSAYEKGGIDLLYETISLNYNIQLDGCVLVNFEDFENIIDKLGGIEITLTAGEAKYLRSTNYISDPNNRNVIAGTQVMNGNQALGYSRVRKVSTITGNNNDYGRTDRHRIILNAIFDKYKTTSKVELVPIMTSILSMITTDIDNATFEVLLNTFIDMNIGTSDLEQLRIPANGTFTDNVKVRGMDVVIPDLDTNIEILHNFIFGEEE